MYKITKKHFAELIKVKKREHKLSELVKLSLKFMKNPNSWWKDVNKLRENKVNLEIEPETLACHYEKLFNDLDMSTESVNLEHKQKRIVNKYKEFVSMRLGRVVIHPNTISEHMWALKNNKKAGFSGARNELFRHAKETTLADEIAELFEMIINNGLLVKNMNIGLVSTIIKDSKGSKTDINNSRPIIVSETLSTLFGS